MSTPIRITPETPPSFPCWLWKASPAIAARPLWIRLESLPPYCTGKSINLSAGGWTHWLPDQPTAPTAIPSATTEESSTAPAPAAAETPEDTLVYREAKRLAEIIWRQFYRNEAPKWKVLDTATGVISQIDNMVAGLREDLTALRLTLQQRDADLATIRETLFLCADRNRDDITTPHLATVVHNALHAARSALSQQAKEVEELKIRLAAAEVDLEHTKGVETKCRLANGVLEGQLSTLRAENEGLRADRDRMDAALMRLRDFVITPIDRSNALREIARKAIDAARHSQKEGV